MQDNSMLKRSATWKLGLSIILCTVVDWSYLSGTAIEKIGYWAPIAWFLTIFAMVTICYSCMEILMMFPNKSGGLATCIIEGYKKRSPLFAVISQWGYVTGWGLAVGAIAAFASYFIQYFIPFPDEYLNYVAIAIVSIVCCINLASVDLIEKIQTLIYVLFVLTFILIVGAVIKLPILSQDFAGIELNSGESTVAIFLSACFVVGWSAASIEAVLTFIGEYKDPKKDTKLALSSGMIVLFVSTFALCSVMTWYLPLDVVLSNPYTPLLPLAEAVYGPLFAKIYGICLVIGLIIATNACLLPASRVLFTASKSGLMPKCFIKLNKNKIPYVAVISIYLVNVLFLITTGGEQPTFLVVAGGMSYFIMVALAGCSVLVMRKDFPDAVRTHRTPTIICYLSAISGVFYLVMLIVGTAPYGLKTITYGVFATLLALPLYWYRIYIEDKKQGIVIEETDLNTSA